MPPNLNDLEVQFLPGGADLFEVSITSDKLEMMTLERTLSSTRSVAQLEALALVGEFCASVHR